MPAENPIPRVPPPAPRPATAPAGNDLNARAKRIQDLVTQLEQVADPNTRAAVQKLLPEILQLHQVGLRRILDLIADTGEGAAPVQNRLLADDVVRGLLLIHDLHPLSLEQRLQQALDKVLPYIRGHGGNVELTSLQDGVAKLRLHGTCQSCSASSITLELAVRAAIEEFCPDLQGFDVEGIEDKKVPPPAASCTEPIPARPDLSRTPQPIENTPSLPPSPSFGAASRATPLDKGDLQSARPKSPPLERGLSDRSALAKADAQRAGCVGTPA
jgi:Fe-S cluster biogenesis protein NfuA